jgi:uncharacterized membrane protein YeaQ/YmgE (transglycosylase-associated protein family)
VREPSRSGAADGQGADAKGRGARGLLARWRRLSGSHGRTLLVALIGAAVGGAYAHFVGCRTGSCPLTSNVWTASLYGAVVGAVLGWPNRRQASQRGAADDAGRA